MLTRSVWGSCLASMSVLAIVASIRLSEPKGAAATAPAAPLPSPVAHDTLNDCCSGEPERAPAPRPGKRILRVYADPNNLPFTNDRLEGFENRIADLVAAEMGAELQYTWRAQRRGFFREALKEGSADLVLAAPVGFDMALTTAPYYRSTYVFVTRKGGPRVQSLDDESLKTLRVGVQLIGDDGTNTPPAHALARRGIVGNLVGFLVYGDYREESPPSRIVEAVAKGDVDVAVAWGPMAGYFAKKQAVPLEVVAVSPAVDEPGLPFTFGIAMGVSRKNKPLREEIDAILIRRKADIDAILDGYGVPRVAKPQGKPKE